MLKENLNRMVWLVIVVAAAMVKALAASYLGDDPTPGMILLEEFIASNTEGVSVSSNSLKFMLIVSNFVGRIQENVNLTLFRH